MAFLVIDLQAFSLGRHAEFVGFPKISVLPVFGFPNAAIQTSPEAGRY